MSNRGQVRIWTRAIALATLALVCAGGAAAAEESAENPGPVLARAFEVRHRPLADAAELVESILSPRGTMWLKPGLKTLVVEDTAAVLDRVASLLDSFDLPPRNVEVTLTLFMGTDRRNEEAGRRAPRMGVSEEVNGVLETLRDFTKWTAYEPLGSRSVTGLEGGQVTAILSDEYRVVFEIDSVEEAQGTIVFKNFSLQRLIRTADGVVRYQNIYSADVALPAGRVHSVGAASGPDSKKALFLTLQAKPR